MVRTVAFKATSLGSKPDTYKAFNDFGLTNINFTVRQLKGYLSWDTRYIFMIVCSILNI